jgi:hypothetical protein
MPHDIIDNRELHLADAVRPLLGQSVRAHFAVGYFFLSGFKAIAEQLAAMQELRLLIGNTRPPETKNMLARLERLRALWSSSPLDGRVEFALRGTLRFPNW